MKHPATIFWKRRGLRPEDEWLRPILDRKGRRLAIAKGEPTEMEEEVIEIFLRATGAVLLEEDQRRKTGIMDKHAHTRYLRIGLDALRLLGTDRRAIDVTPTPEHLRAYLASRAGGNEEAQG